MNIYKYLTFTQFVDMVECQRLYLTRISEWDDVYEAAGLKHAVSTSIPKLAPSFVSEMMGEELMTVLDKNVFDSYYAQSWTISEQESDAMWRIYSPQRDGVRIKMKADTVERSIREGLKIIDPKAQVYQSRVIYRNDNLGEIYVKRKAFEHENEYRFWTVIQMGSINPPPDRAFINDTNGFIRYLEKCHKGVPVSLYYPVSLDMIDEITLDPRAASYHEETFNTYCENRNIGKKVYKKSKLYTEL